MEKLSWFQKPLFGAENERHVFLSHAVAILILFTPVLFSERARRFIASRFARFDLMIKYKISKQKETTKKLKEKLKPPKNEKKGPHVAGIYIYPVKSTKAIPLHKCDIDAYGLKHDRRFMVVRPLPLPIKGYFGPNEATHRFVSQRQAPSLTQITSTAPMQDPELHLLLTHKEGCPGQSTTVTVNLSPAAARGGETYYRVGLWDDVVDAIDMGDQVATFLRQVLKFDALDGEPNQFEDVRLVAMSRNTTNPLKSKYRRNADEKYTPLSALSILGKTPQVSLSDGFPILLVTQASLDEVNRRLRAKKKDAISMAQFRPNIVIGGDDLKPFEEDSWKVIRINGTILHLVKGCPRCKQSCTNQDTGVVSDEPVATLKEFRALGKNQEDVFFGQNVLVQDASSSREPLFVGQPVEVLEYGGAIYE